MPEFSSKPPVDVRIGAPLNWVSEGTRAWVQIPGDAAQHAGCWVLCLCTVAAGKHGKFQNVKYDHHEWHDIRECYALVPTNKES